MDKKPYIAGAVALSLIAPPAIDIGKAVYDTFFHGNNDRIETKLTEAPANPLEKILGGISYAQDPAYAAKRVSIDEYYQNAVSADDIMPGARIGPYKMPVKGIHKSFLNGNWNKMYFTNSRDGSLIKKILQDDPVFDFNKFDEFYQKEGKNFETVVIYREGFIRFYHYNEKEKLIIPISKETVTKLENIQ